MVKILFVEYCADDFMGGTINMDPLTELAYRRICDMIYSTNDSLEDNDSLKYATKTGAKWKKIRQELIDKNKIFIDNGFIRNKKCSEKLQKSRKIIEQNSSAGKSSAAKRKALKNIETASTGVSNGVGVSVEEKHPKKGNETSTNHKPYKKEESKKEKSTKKEKVFEGSEKFLKFWEAYPRHRRGNRDNALAAWERALREGRASEEEILRGALSYAASNPGEWAKGAAAWLNDDRWTWQVSDSAVRLEESKEDWPPWKQSFSAVIGDKAVHSWFSDADFRDGILFVKSKFHQDRIRSDFSESLQKIGLVEVRRGS